MAEDAENRRAAGRIRELAFASMQRGEINESTFVAQTALAMAALPEAFADWLDGYALSRFGQRCA